MTQQPSKRARISKETVKKALLIRRFEERLLRLFSEGKLNGTVHTCIGQEFSALSVIEALREGDAVFSNHRGHGHFIAYSNDCRGLLHEIMGKSSGVCGGIGGSQHIQKDQFFSNGIQGALVPIATGHALSQKVDGQQQQEAMHPRSQALSVVFIGDGTLGEGVLYESLNIASKWSLPLLVVCENNGYAQSTSSSKTLAGSIEGRARAFDVEYCHGEIWDTEELFDTTQNITGYIRQHCRPALLEIESYRLKAHSKGDDDRPRSEIEGYERRDPLARFLFQHKEQAKQWDDEIENYLDRLVQEAEVEENCRFFPPSLRQMTPVQWESIDTSAPKRLVNCLQDYFLDYAKGRSKDKSEQNPDNETPSLEAQPYHIGEDLAAPYGGAFKVSKPLAQCLPSQVYSTPISEAAIVGIGTGLALSNSNKRPFVEIMFGDFTTLIVDQLLNNACKFRLMYNQKVEVPLVVRTPMGGRRGYGPTHSQSLERLYLGIPGLTVLALNTAIDPAKVYKSLEREQKEPVLVIENKVAYTKMLYSSIPRGYELLHSKEAFPFVRIAPMGTLDSFYSPAQCRSNNSQVKQPIEATILCYGGILDPCLGALETLFTDHEVCAEVLCPTKLSPLNLQPIIDSAKHSKALVIAEEGTSFASWSSEVIASLNQEPIPSLKIQRLAYDSIIPSSFQREQELLIDNDQIVQAVLKALQSR